jgi:hypothetical protein
MPKATSDLNNSGIASQYNVGLARQVFAMKSKEITHTIEE